MAHHFAARLNRLALTAAVALLAACGAGETPAPTSGQPAATSSHRVGIDVPANLAATAIATVREAHADAVAAAATETSILAAAARAFANEPNEANRGAFQQAWLDAHNAFAEVLVLRSRTDVEARFNLDAWPITPGYLDSLPTWPNSGIISEPTLAIDAETLESQHGFTDVSEVAMGFHPLEYYAFERPLEDFVSSDNASRRQDMIRVLAGEVQRRIDALAGQVPLAGVDEEAPAEAAGELFALLAGGIQQAAIDAGGRAEGLAHSEFAGSDAAFIEAQMKQIRELLAADGAIMALVTAIDPAAAAGLAEALEIQPGDRNTIVLWLSALDQQLGLLAERLR